MRLENKIALISAAASGMGRAGALLFAREGAKVAAVDIDRAGAEAVAGEIRAAGGEAAAIAADLSRDDESRRVVDAATDAFGGLDVLWNHVGHPGPGRVEGVDMDDYALAMDLNIRSVLVTTAQALPALRARGGGGGPVHRVDRRAGGVAVQPHLFGGQIRRRRADAVDGVPLRAGGGSGSTPCARRPSTRRCWRPSCCGPTARATARPTASA